LTGERTKLLRELDERLQLWSFFSRNGGEVHGIRNRTGQQIVRHLFGDLKRHILLGFRGGGAKMRRADDIGAAEQNVGLGRLLNEDVEGGTGNVTGIERRRERGFVHQSATRTINDANALLHLRDRIGVNDVLGLVGQRRVQRDEVRALQQVL